ncbi:MAG: hypothetical protein ABI596_03835 [Pyrinomonadaceae bacterium]
MNEQLTIEGSDVLLLPFLQAVDHGTAESLLTQLIQEHANPIIAGIIKSKLRVSLSASQGDQDNQDALEIAGDLRATLIADLRAVQQNSDQNLITSFRDYVAVKTYSACADYFREKNPHRRRLKGSLRYQLRHDPGFALWRDANNHWYAGRSEWQGSTSAPGQLPAPGAVLAMFSTRNAQEVTPAELLSAIFEKVGRPVSFENVVTLAAEIWQIADTPLESLDDPEREPERDSVAGVDILLEQRRQVEKLWTEVCELPVLQRVALLLNLRDAQGGSALFFIPHLGIASPYQIAATLELPVEEFSRLWNNLPLDDSAIAQMLGITRQQVINLRKTARERLARRMKKGETLKSAGGKKRQ